MATIAYVGTELNSRLASLVTWSALGNADDGAPFETKWHRDFCVTIIATAYGSATIVLEGSNDGTNYITLADPQGNALSFTTGNRLEQLLEVPRYIRPRTSGGTGTNIAVQLYAKGV